MMKTMLTLFGVDLDDLDFISLQREMRSQKYILYLLKANRTSIQTVLDKRLALEESGEKKVTPKRIQEDKITLCDIYITHLEALIEEIEYLMSKRQEPLSNRNGSKSVADIKARNITAFRKMRKEIKSRSYLNRTFERDGLPIMWDRDKFMLVARDRGYQTEEVVVQDVSRELNIDRGKTKWMLQHGRFTWGQVLCLGAMMQMTPKEFCDTFMAGYFKDHGDDEFRADYENIRKEVLLKRAIQPKPPLEEVLVGSDGKPLDEEEWFD